MYSESIPKTTRRTTTTTTTTLSTTTLKTNKFSMFNGMFYPTKDLSISSRPQKNEITSFSTESTISTPSNDPINNFFDESTTMSSAIEAIRLPTSKISYEKMETNVFKSIDKKKWLSNGKSKSRNLKVHESLGSTLPVAVCHLVPFWAKNSRSVTVKATKFNVYHSFQFICFIVYFFIGFFHLKFLVIPWCFLHNNQELIREKLHFLRF